MNTEDINTGLADLDSELTGAIAVVRDFAQKTKAHFCHSRAALDQLPVDLAHIDRLQTMVRRVDRAIRLLDHLETL